jgi:hypothetical protein
MDFDIDFDDLFDNAVLCAALATVQDETGQGNLDRKKLWTTALPGRECLQTRILVVEIGVSVWRVNCQAIEFTIAKPLKTQWSGN